MKKYIISITILFLGGRIAVCQTLRGYDGALENFGYGQTYTIQPLPPSDSTVSPTITGYEWGEPMLFILTANKGDQFSVSFYTTTDPRGCFLFQPTSLPANSLRLEGHDTRYDPNVPNIFTTDSSGKVTFVLGFTIIIPWETRDVGSFPIVCRIVNMKTEDSLSASAGIWLFNHGPLDDTWCKTDSLSPGYTYSITPSNGTPSISPIINGAEQGRSRNFRIDAEPGDSAIFQFYLPTSLASDIEDGTSIPCHFQQNALYIEETGEYRNPNTPFLYHFTSNCYTSFDLGITLDVPPDIPPGTYSGTALVAITFIGNAGSDRRTTTFMGSWVSFYVSIADYKIPESFSLSQNYPNPFNPGTKIRYGLPEPANVNITIFDVLGRQVATLVNEFKYAGWHTLDWQAHELPSGMYIYRLNTPYHSEMKKMLLVR